MSEHAKYRVTEQKSEGGSLPSYVLGFASSIFLTLVAYFLTINHALKGYNLIIVLMELAVLQFTVQLFFFLHFGKGKSAGVKLLTVVLMLIFVIILVAGSIWIMQSLNYNMNPSQIQDYMKQQINEGF